jgi:uncharacterized membrane protein YfcA
MQADPSLLSQLDWLTLFLVGLAAFATALFHSVAGFAGALLLSVCLAPLIGVRAVVPVVAFAMIISNSNRVLLFREHIEWKAYRAIMITGLPGIVLGSVVFLFLSVKSIALALGSFLLLSIPLRRIFKKRNYKVGYRGLSTVGIIYGVVSGTVFGGGLILGPFLLGAGIVGQGIVGMVAALGLTLNITKSLVFGLGNLLDAELISLGVVVGVCTIPGGMLGKWIVKRSDIAIHTVVVEVLMLAGGCYFLYQAFYMH